MNPAIRRDFVPASSHGFTLVELVVIMVIVGVLAAVAGPRFMGRNTFDSRGFYDKAAATVRFAQKNAVAWRRPVFVCVTANQVRAGTTADCSTALATETAPSGVTLNPSAASFSFNGLGAADANVTIGFTSTIPGDPARSIAVTAATGFIAVN